MLDRRVVRFGGGAIMLGSLLAFVFNLLHPRSSDIDNVAEELRLAADKGIWVFDHYMLAWAVALSFIGLVVIGRSFATEPARSLGRIAIAVAIGSVAIALATVVIDGFATNKVAEELAAGEGSFDTASAVANVGLALFLTTIGSLFGLTPVLFGSAMVLSDEYPKWLGYLAIAAGIVGLLSATVFFFDGPSTFSINVLFIISSLAFTVWGFVTGWQLWNRSAAVAATPEPRTTVAA